MFNQIEQALPRMRTVQKVKQVARSLEKLLLSHAEEEEDLVLLAPAQQAASRQRFERFFAEHQEIDVRLTQLHATKDLDTARRLLRAAMAASRKHFLHEERVFFPLLEQVLGPEAQERLGTLWRVRHQTPV